MSTVRRGAAHLGKITLLAALYVVAAKAAFGLAFVNTSISPVWLPSGLAMAAVVILGYRAAPGVLLGAFLFNASTPVPLWVAGLIAVGNTVEAVSGAWLLRRVGFRQSMDRVRDVLALGGLAALAGTALSASVGVATLVAAGVVPLSGARSSWLLWWSGDAVGVLTLTPILLVLWATRGRHVRFPRGRVVEACALMLILPLIVAMGLVAGMVGTFLVFLALVWAAIRFRQVGANLASLFSVSVVVWATTHGYGPFVQAERLQSLLVTQTYVAVVMATGLLLAAMTLEREHTGEALRRATAEVELRNDELERERAQLGEAQRIAHLGSWEWDVVADVVRWSDEMYRVFGLEPQSVPIDYAGFLDRVHLDDRERVGAAVGVSYTSGTPFSFVHRVVRPDGELRYVHADGMPVVDDTGMVVRMVGTGQDVTERRHVEEALRIQQERTRSIIATASDAFVGIDESGRVTDWNRKAETTFGWNTAEAVGRLLTDLIVTERDHAAHNAWLREALADPRSNPLDDRREVHARHRDGHEIPIELAAWSVESSAGRHINAFARDITERKQFELALATARDEAVEASQLKSRFLATMSHEIRTPMNAVIGLAQLLLDTPLDSGQHRHAEGIRSAGDALMAIINDILDFSKIEADHVVLDDTEFDLEAVLTEVVGLLAESARGKGLTLTATCHPKLPTELRGDPGRLRQILLNLVSNAVKFTQRGEVAIRASFADVVDAHGDPLPVRIEVIDTGIGIAEEALEWLFDPFVQADASTTREYGGTGLGLAISRRLAHAMHGQLEVTSRPGHGSTFCLTVPLALAHPTAPEPPAEPAAPPTPGHGRHLLLVEDNALNQMVAVGLLKKLGYTVDVAANGLEGVTMAKATSYQAILMDCQMPQMDGYAATAALRELEGSARHTPIIALTAGAMAEDRERCLAAGMDDFVSKPFDLAELAAMLIRWTDGDRRDAEGTPAVPAVSASP